MPRRSRPGPDMKGDHTGRPRASHLTAVKRLLLNTAYDALPDGGALIVYDAIIDDERSSNAFGLLMSLNMLIETPGGFDYTASDCAAWMRSAGFSHTRAEHLAGPDGMVVAIK